jgi:hypothetical protein
MNKVDISLGFQPDPAGGTARKIDDVIFPGSQFRSGRFPNGSNGRFAVIINQISVRAAVCMFDNYLRDPENIHLSPVDYAFASCIANRECC